MRTATCKEFGCFRRVCEEGWGRYRPLVLSKLRTKREQDLAKRYDEIIQYLKDEKSKLDLFVKAQKAWIAYRC